MEYRNPMFGANLQDLLAQSYVYHTLPNATHSLYVDGTFLYSKVDQAFQTMQQREKYRVSGHASKLDIFRPYPGFQRVRLIKKTTPKGRDFYLCFVDFNDSI